MPEEFFATDYAQQEQRMIVGLDLAVAGKDITAKQVSLFNTGKFVRVMLILCEVCHWPNTILILNKKTNKWCCTGCCDQDSI